MIFRVNRQKDIKESGRESITNIDMETHSESSYLIEGMPRSLHIFFARISLISECLGMADL
jgi:hypothetical protein